MGKKKRQGEPNASVTNNSDSSSESSNEFGNCTSDCSHVTKSVDLNRLKKALQRCTEPEECEECKRNPEEITPENSEILEFDTSLWMCLRCGNRACGRYQNQHALQHYRTPHSDSHSLCLNLSNWNVWCYDCNDEVNVSAKKKLVECVEYLRKHSETSRKNNVNSNSSDKMKVMEVEGNISSGPQLELAASGLSLPRARGLTNLGNTCFFNSVMQCLGQTPYLLQLLDETSEPGQHFNLPGGKFLLDDKEKENIEVDPLEGSLEEWGPLTKVLAETLRELQSGRPEVFNPRSLLSQLTRRVPQFAGGDQHDSHELLRHLLEAVREEDLRRYQSVILQKFGLSSKTNPTGVEGDKKKIIKFYGAQASEFLLPTEQVFRGVLVSTLQCQDCEHTSHRDEFFLDLSLPISEKQTPPVMRWKSNELDDKPSKYQLKKEKKLAKKNKKVKHNRSGASIDQTGDTPMDDNNNSESESDADVEDNAEDTANNSRSPDEGPVKGTESGYNSDKNGGSPENPSPVMCVDDSGVPSPAVGMLCVSPLAPGSPDNSPASSETNIDMGSPIGGRNTPNDDLHDVMERPESRLSFVHNKNNDLKCDLEKLTLENDRKKELDGAYGGFYEDEKMDVDNEDMWVGTISARCSIEDGECSVQSCLNQFTTCELMTANNKVGCELCTKRYGGVDKKTVYTNAKKQFLIYNPPAVLILHLKRFQVYHFRPAKMSKNVKFPTLLDIAPFCSRRSKMLPTFEPNQTRVLYSLYGVVEHSGSMHGGHYVSYVKVRPKLSADSYRWNFLPKNQRKDTRGTIPQNVDVPTGKWYYISDSYASEIDEKRVLDANAYLLFYERIL